MPVAARSDEHGSRLHPFPGVRPPRRGQWTAKAHQPRTALVTAAKVSSDRMKGNQFSSCNISFPYRPNKCAPLQFSNGKEIRRMTSEVRIASVEVWKFLLAHIQ